MDDYTSLIFDDKIRVITCDVFDTILLRRPWCELFRFEQIAKRQSRLLQKRLNLQVPHVEILWARLAASKIDYQTAPHKKECREGCMERIYWAICRMIGLDAQHASLLIEDELIYETSVMCKNRGLEKALCQAEKQGKQVIFLSDMYLGAEKIRSLLESHNLALRKYTVYSSADHGIAKHCKGALFDFLLEKENIRKSEQLHLGDNLYSDVEVPQVKGIMACHMPRSRGFNLTNRIHNYWMRKRLADVFI